MIFHYQVIFIFILLNLLLVFKYKTIAKKLNIFDYPGPKRKIHKKKTPLLGGIIIAINIFVFSIFYLFFASYIPEIQSNFNNKIDYLIFFLTCFALFFLGTFDDKKNLGAALKP